MRIKRVEGRVMTDGVRKRMHIDWRRRRCIVPIDVMRRMRRMMVMVVVGTSAIRRLGISMDISIVEAAVVGGRHRAMLLSVRRSGDVEDAPSGRLGRLVDSTRVAVAILGRRIGSSGSSRVDGQGRARGST